jgi:hypothetical protein
MPAVHFERTFSERPWICFVATPVPLNTPLQPQVLSGDLLKVRSLRLIRLILTAGALRRPAQGAAPENDRQRRLPPPQSSTELHPLKAPPEPACVAGSLVRQRHASRQSSRSAHPDTREQAHLSGSEGRWAPRKAASSSPRRRRSYRGLHVRRESVGVVPRSFSGRFATTS